MALFNIWLFHKKLEESQIDEINADGAEKKHNEIL